MVEKYSLESECTARVARGVELLNKRFPNWFMRINIHILDLDSSANCILGQLFGDYKSGIKTIGEEFISDGFCPTSASSKANEMIKSAWIKQIHKLRNINK